MTMNLVANVAVAPSSGVVLARASNDRLNSAKRAGIARRKGIPHWNVAFMVAGGRSAVSIVTYAHDRGAAVSSAKKAVQHARCTLLWAFETLDREKVQDLLSAARLRQRNAARGNDMADEARARIDVARFQRELEILESSILV